MKVERFDPETDGASVRACHEIYLSGLPDDDPLGPPMSPQAFAGWLALGWTGGPTGNVDARGRLGRALRLVPAQPSAAREPSPRLPGAHGARGRAPGRP